MGDRMKKKVLLIQPHSDDALFSAFHFMFDEKYDVSVLTIENNSKRVKEDEKLYEFLNIPYHHLNLEFNDESFYSFHKKYKEVNSDNAVEHLIEFFGNELVDSIRKEVVKFINDFKTKHKDVQIIVPWGVGHPMHIFIRDIAESCSNDLWYYRDFPHSYKKRARSQVEDQWRRYELVDSVDVSEFHDVKWELARKFYKSQSGLFWFEQGYIKKRLSEEVYKLKAKK